MAERRDSR